MPCEVSMATVMLGHVLLASYIYMLCHVSLATMMLCMVSWTTVLSPNILIGYCHNRIDATFHLCRITMQIQHRVKLAKLITFNL